MSSMYLDGKPSVLALAKNENPLSRDHLRVFSMGTAPDGQPRWGIAATRDLHPTVDLPGNGHGLSFGHAVDKNTAGERDLVMHDLLQASPTAAKSWSIVSGSLEDDANHLKIDHEVYEVNV